MEKLIFEMEMPTPCDACGETFDLNDGRCSEKWYPDTTICEECYSKEEQEIESDEETQDAILAIAEAMSTINDNVDILVREIGLSKENFDKSTYKQLIERYSSVYGCYDLDDMKKIVLQKITPNL